MSFIRLIQRSSVLLPQPDGPINAVTWFRGMDNERLWIAWKAPYQASKFAISMQVWTGPVSTADADPLPLGDGSVKFEGADSVIEVGNIVGPQVISRKDRL